MNNWLENELPPPMTFARGLRLDLPIIFGGTGIHKHGIALLGCYDRSSNLTIGIIIKQQVWGVIGRLIQPIGIPLRETILQDFWLLRTLFQSISFKAEEVRLTVANRILVDDSSAISAGYTLTEFYCNHTDQQCTCSSKTLEHGFRIDGRRAAFLYQSPNYLPFWILLGKFIQSDPLAIYSPGMMRAVVRAGFFQKGDNLEEKLREMFEQPTRTLQRNKKTLSWLTTEKLDADYVIETNRCGVEIQSLYNWGRVAEVLERRRKPRIRLQVTLRRSSFPEFDDSAVEERLIIKVIPESEAMSGIVNKRSILSSIFSILC